MLFASNRSLRGGSFNYYDGFLHAAYRYMYIPPSVEVNDIGFRVAEVTGPVPAVSTWGLGVLGLLVVTTATVVIRRQRRAVS